MIKILPTKCEECNVPLHHGISYEMYMYYHTADNHRMSITFVGKDVLQIFAYGQIKVAICKNQRASEVSITVTIDPEEEATRKSLRFHESEFFDKIYILNQIKLLS